MFVAYHILEALVSSILVGYHVVFLLVLEPFPSCASNAKFHSPGVADDIHSPLLQAGENGLLPLDSFEWIAISVCRSC